MTRGEEFKLDKAVQNAARYALTAPTRLSAKEARTYIAMAEASLRDATTVLNEIIERGDDLYVEAK